MRCPLSTSGFLLFIYITLIIRKKYYKSVLRGFNTGLLNSTLLFLASPLLVNVYYDLVAVLVQYFNGQYLKPNSVFYWSYV